MVVERTVPFRQGRMVSWTALAERAGMPLKLMMIDGFPALPGEERPTAGRSYGSARRPAWSHCGDARRSECCRVGHAIRTAGDPRCHRRRIGPVCRAGSVSDSIRNGAVAHAFGSEIAIVQPPASDAGLVPTRASSTECESVSFPSSFRQLHQADEVACSAFTSSSLRSST